MMEGFSWATDKKSKGAKDTVQGTCFFFSLPLVLFLCLQ